ncbi:MAG TPA: hypothetical protein VHC90_10630 [Bryobacteraceae bacterium]|nr:hypothetical protein [Bryobacteraceae bacterium]
MLSSFTGLATGVLAGAQIGALPRSARPHPHTGSGGFSRLAIRSALSGRTAPSKPLEHTLFFASEAASRTGRGDTLGGAI